MPDDDLEAAMAAGYRLGDGQRPAPTFAMKDSGQRQTWDTGAQRDRQEGKGRFDLIAPEAVRRLAEVLEKGAAKYSDRNWEKGMPLSRFLDSALRHEFQLLAGAVDEDHAGQALWNLHAFIAISERIQRGELPAELDDLGYTTRLTDQLRADCINLVPASPAEAGLIQ